MSTERSENRDNTQELALLSFAPKFCPNCGKPIVRQKDQDWAEQCSHYCLACKMTYAFLPHDTILEVSSIAGDMDRYTEYNDRRDDDYIHMRRPELLDAFIDLVNGEAK